MQGAQPNLFFRDDTILGVCEALGEDFGFNPFILRVVLASSLLWNPAIVVGGYLAAGVVVAISRWLAPNPRAAKVAEIEPASAPAVPATLQSDEVEELAVAA
jgi:phage shock protein C